MKRIYHQGMENREYEQRLSLCSLRRYVPYLKSSAVLMLAALFASSIVAQTQQTKENRTHYQIHLALDIESRTYTGTERVRWVNQGDHPTATLFCHLYPNVRVPGYTAPKTEPGSQTSDEPRLEITEVRSVANESILSFALDDQETTLHINLREPLMPNAATEIQIKFKGSVPEIDPEETGLVTHVMQQVSAAIRSTREMRRARDTNFRCRGVMMLGSFYPVLAARDGDDWARKIDLSIGDIAMTDV